MCFECSKLQIKNYLKKKKKKHLKFLLKHVSENWKEKLFPSDSSFINNLKNAKTNTMLTI